MAYLQQTFASLVLRPYRRLWAGSMLATTAFMMSFMLVPSVAYELTGDNTSAGLAQMGAGVAMLFVSPIGGVIADRLRKKPLVLAGQIVPSAVILATGILIRADLITVPILSGATLIMGLGFAFMGPARQAWVAELVTPQLLPNAIALQQIATNIAQVAAPLLVAVLVGPWLDIGGAYLFMASLFVIVLPLTISLPNTTPKPKQAKSVSHELGAGISYVWSDLRLRTLWLAFLGVVVTGFAFQTLLPGMLDQELGRDPTSIGGPFLAMAVAGLVLNLWLAGMVGTRWAWPILLIMGMVLAGAYIAMAVAPSYGLAVAAAIPLGAGRSGFMLIDNALLMSYSEPAYHGRVMSLAMMGFGSQALLAPVWGLLGDQVGVRSAMMVAGFTSAVLTVAVGVTWLQIRRGEDHYEVA